MLDPEHACARCHRITPEDELRLWTTRERLRETARFHARQSVHAAVTAGAAETADASPPPEPGPRPPAISYRWITVAHALCGPCHAAVEADGDRFHALDRRRAVVIALAFVGVAAGIWLGFAPFAGHWIAAFWRNGAGVR